MQQTDHINWAQAAQELSFPQGLFIHGQFQAAQSGDTYVATNPATAERLGDVAIADEADVNNAVRSARQAFEQSGWASSAPEHRKAVLLKLADLIETHAVEFALLDSLNMGKRIKDAYEIDVSSSAATLRWYAEALDKVYGETAPSGADSVGLVERTPLGVVAAITPWNYPLVLAMWKLAPALAMGNSVILKPSEQSPYSILRLAELAIEAGLPAGVFNVVTGLGPSTGQALARHHDVDCLAFTGSTAVGKKLMMYSAESNMKPVWLECGGKSPNLVFADVSNLEKAAEMACYGIFGSQGQICSANSRLLVERPIYEQFVQLLKEKSVAYLPGDPLKLESGSGVMVDQKQADRVLAYIEIAKSEGRIVLGGQAGPLPASVQPTIVVDVCPHSRIAQEEVFGPVLTVIPFDEEAEAIQIANQSIYGLAASVWTDNLHRAHRVAKQLQAGTVSVNTMDALSLATPFGGFKQSGFGRDLSLHAFDKYSGLKTTWIQLQAL